MRKYIFVCCVLFLFVMNGFANQVDFYRNKVIYSYVPKSNFLGFNKNIEVKCNDRTLKTFRDFLNDENCFLCGKFKKINELENSLKSVEFALNLLQSASKNFRIENGNLKIIDDLSRKFSELNNRRLTTKAALSKIKGIFSKGAKDSSPYFADLKGCNNITIKFDGVNFRIKNELVIQDISNNRAKIAINKRLNVINQSGVDILAEDAYFHFRKFSEYIPVLDFQPFVLREQKPTKEFFRMTKSAVKGKEYMPEKIEKVEDRVYNVKNLLLPSNGESYRFLLESVIRIADYRLITYPFIDSNVYKQIVFKLPFDLENDMWDVVTKNGVFYNVRGYLKDGNYFVNYGKNYSLKVRRVKNIEYEKSPSFFGNKKKIKDGYTITLTNVSNNIFSVKIIDRVPISGSDKIEVKDVEISDDRCVLKENGLVECDVTVNGGSTLSINVNYVIIYDKDVDLNY